MGLVAPRHVESFWTRGPCIGGRILNHRTAREVPGPEIFAGCCWLQASIASLPRGPLQHGGLSYQGTQPKHAIDGVY